MASRWKNWLLDRPDQVRPAPPPAYGSSQFDRDRGFGTAPTARLFALLNAAIFDAFVATWDAKYTYWSIRPVTVIRERPRSWVVRTASMTQRGFRTWSLRPSRPTPSATAPSRPPLRVSCSTSSQTRARIPTLSSARWVRRDHQIAEEVALSRLIGGIHFRSDNDAALVLGRRVTGLALVRAQEDGSGL